MNKQDFLQELQSRIRILEEAEQQDILAEYAQHIDLRMAGGLSEEEAIQDFGDPGQLAAEILEAYHVDPSRLSTPAQPKQAAQALRRSAAGIRDRFSRLGHSISERLRRCGRGIAACWRRRGQQLKSLVHHTHRPKDTNKEASSMSHAPRSHAVLLHIKQAGRWLGRLLAALVHLAWNLLMLLVILPFAVAGLLALLCIGLLAVLLVQGYPLAGPLLCGIGLVLCCAALVGLCATLFHRRRTANNQGEAPAACTSDPEEEGLIHA